MFSFSPLPLGTILENRYKLIEDRDSNKTNNQHLLGSGGFGAVYLAHDLSLNCEVAIKQSILLNEKNSLRMFKREAQFLANLSHPALPKVSRFFSEEESCFIVMDLIRGDDLEERVSRSGNLPFAEVRDIALQLFEVLDYLHTHSIIHKDIKPANLKYTSGGQLKLLDFGLAKGSVGLMSEHKETIVKGLTPAWAPPEQLNSKPTTKQSDLYSAAATIYFLASGLLPPNAHKRALEIAIYQIDTLGRLDKMKNLQVPDWFAEVITEGLSLSMEKRPPSAAAMRERLAKLWVETQPILQDDPEDVRYFKDGNNCYNQRAFSEAIDNYDKAIALNPNFANAYHKRADAYFNRNNFNLGLYTQDNYRDTRIDLNQAIQDLTKAIELQTDFVDAYTQRAITYFFKRHFRNCIKDCDAAIKLNPNCAEAYCTRGRAFWVLAGQRRFERSSYLDKALRDCDKAVELQPALAQAYAARGNVYSTKGNHNQAVNDCTRSIRLSSLVDSHKYFLGRGIAYFSRGTFAQAISDCSKAIELQPELLVAYYYRAKAYRKLGAKANAQNDRQKAAELIALQKKAWAGVIIFWLDWALAMGLIVSLLWGSGSWQRWAGWAMGLSFFVVARRLQQATVSMVLLTAVLSFCGLIAIYLWLFIR